MKLQYLIILSSFCIIANGLQAAHRIEDLGQRVNEIGLSAAAHQAWLNQMRGAFNAGNINPANAAQAEAVLKAQNAQIQNLAAQLAALNAQPEAVIAHLNVEEAAERAEFAAELAAAGYASEGDLTGSDDEQDSGSENDEPMDYDPMDESQ